jgi:hypothetical protein
MTASRASRPPGPSDAPKDLTQQSMSCFHSVTPRTNPGEFTKGVMSGLNSNNPVEGLTPGGITVYGVVQAST